jgi:hypothetical protein
MVDNSDCSPTRLTAWERQRILASRGALPSQFKRRGLVWLFLCSCSYSWSVSSSLWRCFGVMTGSISGPPHKEEPSAARSTVCSSPAAQTIDRPVVLAPLPYRVECQRLLLCDPGAREKAGEEHPNVLLLRDSLVPTRGARPTRSPMHTSMPLSALASTTMPSASRPFAVKPATALSLPDVTPPCIV